MEMPSTYLTSGITLNDSFRKGEYKAKRYYLEIPLKINDYNEALKIGELLKEQFSISLDVNRQKGTKRLLLCLDLDEVKLEERTLEYVSKKSTTKQ